MLSFETSVLIFILTVSCGCGLICLDIEKDTAPAMQKSFFYVFFTFPLYKYSPDIWGVVTFVLIIGIGMYLDSKRDREWRARKYGK